MLVHPMIAAWEPPRIERIAAYESRRLAVLPVAGLSGDLHQDLGRGALAVEIVGSLAGDEARDDFLKAVREKFLAGEPVDFVADIVKESELERVLIEELAVEEVAGVPDSFRYRIVLREYTEPPEPSSGFGGLGSGFGDLGIGDLGDLDAGLGADLDALAQSGLDLLDLPAIAGAIPSLPDILAPLKPAAQSLKQALQGAGPLLAPVATLVKQLQGEPPQGGS
ncbi:MAG TPA: hypothetical protein VF173_28495 [Thermoanaerobaculia bacterium]|nr:hypothetical protein [Thermoanaerobaculia bacterium]